MARASRSGLPYTPTDDYNIRRLVACCKSYRMIANWIGRTEASVKNRAKFLKLTSRYRPARHRRFLARVTTLYRQKLNDAAIARLLRKGRATIRDARLRLNLPVQAATLALHQHRHQRMLAAVGAVSLAAVRYEMERASTCRAGWPPGCTRAQAAILALAEARPVCRREISLARGRGRVHRSGVRSFRNLVKLGWLVPHHYEGVPVSGGRRLFYTLAPAVVARRQRFQAAI